MILKLILLSMMVVCTLAQTPSANTFLSGISRFIPTFNEINLFGGPSDISNASTTPTTTIKPTKDKMMYYYYYTVAVGCESVHDLSCEEYCAHIKKDINEYKVLENSTYDTRALVALSISRNEIVIVYRGTKNFWNLLLDAMFVNYTPFQGSQIKIHRGFYIAAMSLYDDVVKTIKSLRSQHSTSKIVITGYSMGAAMSRITELFLIAFNQFPGADYEVYTFGEPRSGNQGYVDYLNRQTLTTARITNRADIVPHLPPTSILGTTIISDYYLHVQTEYWINGRDKQTFANQNMYEDPTCSNSLAPAYNTLDHSTYFDVDLNKCDDGDDSNFFAFPDNFQPAVDLPPLPEYIVD